jgi:outer membrane immunogenic protein
MKKFWIVAAALSVLASFPASAADLEVKAPIMPAPVLSWTGFYIGGNFGGGVASTRFDDPCFYCSSATPTGGFGTIGAQAGYNYQMGNALVGVEGDINWNSSLKTVVLGGDDSEAIRVGLNADYSGTLRARGGIVMNNVLFYGTAGAAWAHVNQTGIDFFNTCCGPFGTPTGITANSSGTVWGGVVGVGMEVMMGPNWTIGGELLHTMYANKNVTLTNPDGTVACGTPSSDCFIRSQLTTDVARIRFNYKFGY